MSELKCGDVVELKSGSPKMTLGIYDEDEDSWYCQWFRESDLNEGDFYADQLKLV